MANLIATPRNWARKAIVLKTETDYNDNTTPTGADNWFEARDVSFSGFEAQTKERNIVVDHLSGGGSIITSIGSKLSFKLAITGSGTAGVAPKWGLGLLHAGFSQTVDVGVSTTYNLVSDAIKSCAVWMDIDGVMYKFCGARGNVKATYPNQDVPTFSVELTSLYTRPVVGSIAGIVKDGWMFEDAVGSANTSALVANGTDLACSSFEWDLGNEVSRLDLPGPQVEVRIRGRKPKATATVLAPSLTVFNPYELAELGTPITLAHTHGKTAGKIVESDLRMRLLGISETEVEGIPAYNLTFDRLPSEAGNDELTVIAR